MWAEAPTPVSTAERQAFAAGASAAAAAAQQQLLSTPPNGSAAGGPFSSSSGAGRRQGTMPRVAEDGSEAGLENGPAAGIAAEPDAAGAASGSDSAGPDVSTGTGGMLLLDVVVCLKALVPEVNAASLAIMNR